MKRNNVLRNTQGFTLVELAIVLVIIGLIIGGVLKGRELITSGKVKSTANQLAAVSSATESYKDKFKQLPFPNISSLQTQGFVTGSAGMKNKFGGDVYIVKSYADGGKIYSAVVSATIPGDLAQLVDEMLDDNKGDSGTVRIFEETTAPTAIPPIMPAGTLQTGTNATTKTTTTVVYLF